MTNQPTAPTMRFKALGGATVEVRVVSTPLDQLTHTWRCTGCHKRPGIPMAERRARDEANTHAGRCRAMPPDDTQAANPSAGAAA